MTKIEAIKKAVEQLSPSERAKFRAWFEEFEAQLFDARIESDAKAGKLDKLIAEARANHEAGRREEF
jgi:ABC-type Zn uptake system ZnuABC Zn-binding protein ZnuA